MYEKFELQIRLGKKNFKLTQHDLIILAFIICNLGSMLFCTTNDIQLFFPSYVSMYGFK